MPHPIAIVLGTRPDAIKLAPVVLELRDRGIDHLVVSTGQHRELLDDVLDAFDLHVDVDLEVMRPGQSLVELHTTITTGMARFFDNHRVARCVVQGDTSTAFSAALAAHYAGIPVAHVEAGLRTRDLAAPWPEEFHRQAIARFADLHFAPTDDAAHNLMDERVGGRIEVVGNTVIDALTRATPTCSASLPVESPYVLVTCHRREQSVDDFAGVIASLRDVASQRPDLEFLFPVHPNPVIRAAVETGLTGLDNVRVSKPLPYATFVAAMKGAHAILTDSGGVQEEAVALGRPVLVMRDASDRPEAITAGAATVVGTDPDRILAALADPPSAQARDLFGDGRSAARIVGLLS